jgi:PTH1 family peptidyl-tRNA hydrolase
LKPSEEPKVILVVGLGNPGAEYQHSPHNMGFAVVERLALRLGVELTRHRAHALCAAAAVGDKKVWLIQPQTFMNLSGKSVTQWLEIENCGPEDLIVVYDELDLPWGRLQIRQQGGSAGHNGMESIISSIGTRQFPRLRVGVGLQHKGDPVTYLLKPASLVRRKQMELIADQAAEAVEMMIRDGVARAMNHVNRRQEPEKETDKSK